MVDPVKHAPRRVPVALSYRAQVKYALDDLEKRSDRSGEQTYSLDKPHDHISTEKGLGVVTARLMAIGERPAPADKAGV